VATDWTDRDELFNLIVWGYGYAKTKRDLASGYFIDAEYWRVGFNWSKSLMSLIDGCQALGVAIDAMYLYNNAYEPRYAVPYYLNNHVGVTWKSICEAWVRDDFEGRFWTIGIIDRMRQIMWDEPFDLTWAARPELGEM